MTQSKVKSIVTAVAQHDKEISDDSPAVDARGCAYRSPRMFPIGQAKDLMRGHHGPVRDYSGWYNQP
jgi:hypothetical protein